jgi:hypothetical protein
MWLLDRATDHECRGIDRLMDAELEAELMELADVETEDHEQGE